MNILVAQTLIQICKEHSSFAGSNLNSSTYTKILSCSDRGKTENWRDGVFPVSQEQTIYKKKKSIGKRITPAKKYQYMLYRVFGD